MKDAIISFMLTVAVITSVALTGFPVFADDSVIGNGTNIDMSSTVKVGLKYGNTALASYSISSDEGFYIGSVADGNVISYMPITAYKTINAVSENGNITVKGSDGTIVLQDLGSYIIFPLNYVEGSTLNFGSTPYRGGIFFTKNSGETLNAINILSTDQYVFGVLNSEMNHGHPMEALKAQAVAARSFATSNKDRHSAYGFDICTGTHCQVYKGYSDEYTETVRAVNETANLSLYYDGQPVSAYYCKNSGGYTQDAKDVWGSAVPYLKAVNDKYSPDYPWTATYTFGDLEDKLAAANNNIGTIVKVEITSRNQAGAVEKLKFTGTNGTVTYSKEKIRTLFGASVIKSTMFSFSNSVTDGGSTEPSLPITQSLYLSNGITSRSLAKGDVYVIGASKVPQSKDVSKLYVTNGSKTLVTSPTNGEIQNENNKTSECVTKSPLVFVGKGYGHGVGMPQDSAIEMAKQGFTYDAILKYYYTGIEIK